MIRHLLVLGCALASPAVGLAQNGAVKVQPPNVHGSRMPDKLLQTTIMRDYMQSWKSLRTAFEQNSAAALNPEFAGTALTKLSATVAEQAKAGIHTRYQDQSHNVQIVFYSPQGLSLQLIDDVVYQEDIFDQSRQLTSQQVHARYVVVMTPAQTRWQVRLFQEASQ